MQIARILPALILCLPVLGSGIDAFAQSGAPAATPAARAAAAKATIDVSEAWTRATPGRASTAAVYLRIVNAGKDPDTLNGAEVENAQRAALHTTTMAGNVAQMTMAPTLPIPRSSTVALAPGKSHIMLEGLKAPLIAGESFIITLVFAKAGKISTTVKVMGAAATGPAAERPAPPAPSGAR